INNTSYIQILVNNSLNKEEIYLKLRENAEFKYSMNFQFGQNSQRVTIMTAHASKGLEFDEIVMAGIHTNASKVRSSEIVGKIPLSFKWFKDSSQKKPYKTPYYLYEEILAKHKDFSESKRLFYVVGTRAKQKIIWFDWQSANLEIN